MPKLLYFLLLAGLPWGSSASYFLESEAQHHGLGRAGGWQGRWAQQSIHGGSRWGPWGVQGGFERTPVMGQWERGDSAGGFAQWNSVGYTGFAKLHLHWGNALQQNAEVWYRSGRAIQGSGRIAVVEFPVRHPQIDAQWESRLWGAGVGWQGARAPWGGFVRGNLVATNPQVSESEYFVQDSLWGGVLRGGVSWQKHGDTLGIEFASGSAFAQVDGMRASSPGDLKGFLHLRAGLDGEVVRASGSFPNWDATVRGLSLRGHLHPTTANRWGETLALNRIFDPDLSQLLSLTFQQKRIYAWGSGEVVGGGIDGGWRWNGRAHALRVGSRVEGARAHWRGVAESRTGALVLENRDTTIVRDWVRAWWVTPRLEWQYRRGPWSLDMALRQWMPLGLQSSLDIERGRAKGMRSYAPLWDGLQIESRLRFTLP